jgi:hypothetical protein
MDMPQTAVSRSKSWTDEQRLEFGVRLKWALQRVGYKRTADALVDVQQCASIKLRTFYAHVAGNRVPDDDGLIEIYAQLFDVPADYLLLRADAPKGPSRGRISTDEVRERLDLNTAPKRFPVPRPVNQVTVNQLLENDTHKASQVTETRYISILTASDIKDLLTGARKLRAMSRERLPVPQDLAAGPNVIAYKIPVFDHSMVGAEGDSFPPGIRLIFDPDRAIAPGDYLLALPQGADSPILRRLQSAHAYLPTAPRYPFKLVAISPLAAPIFVETAEDCAILGRLIFEMRSR